MMTLHLILHVTGSRRFLLRSKPRFELRQAFQIGPTLTIRGRNPTRSDLLNPLGKMGTVSLLTGGERR